MFANRKLPGTKLIFCVVLLSGVSQLSGICVHGIISDRLTGRRIAYATIRNSETRKGCVADSLGQFELCDAKISNLEVRHASYKDVIVLVNNKNDEERTISICLEERIQTTKEVEVLSSVKTIDNSVFTGSATIRQEDILKLPSILGEKDVIKAIQLQAGVQSVSEGMSGLFVRGGSAGQNLFVLDGMELMNPSHLMGIYSIFNPLTTGYLNVYKGNAPVELSDHLSSTIVVKSKLPQKGESCLAGSIGNISSTIALQGISKDEKVSFVAGFRRSYLDVLGVLSSVIVPEDQNYFKRNKYNFYDLNGLFAWHTSRASLMTLGVYTGHDCFRMSDSQFNSNAGTEWGNCSVALNYQYSPFVNCIFKHGVNYTSVFSSFDGILYDNSLQFKSAYYKIQQKNSLILQFKAHSISAGIDFFFTSATPQKMVFYLSGDTISKHEVFRNKGIVLYVGDNLQIKNNIELYGGLRYTTNATVDLCATNSSLSPVLALSFRLPREHSLKVALSENSQQVHLCSFSSVPLPNDIWMNSTARLKPETSTQLTIGYYKKQESWNYGIELYGKMLRNQLLFNLDVDGMDDRHFENNFYIGKGRAFGVDFSFHKSFRSYSVDLNYSFARSFRSYPEIMNGSWFRDKYDRIHDLKVQINRKLSRKWDCSLVWVYATGNTTTLPVGRWWMMGSVMNDYAGINNIRLPAYHRLDIAANYKLTSKRFKESVLSFSLINVYNRSNPYFLKYRLSMDKNQYNLNVNVAQISLFPIMPSVNWRFKL
jgi:Outer membrane receptor proteins, mostly Fe transport